MDNIFIGSSLENKIEIGEPFHQKNAIDPSIFSWNELERILNLRPFVNSSRLRLLNSKSYRWIAGWWLSDRDTYPPKLLHKEVKNCVSVLHDCSRINESINSLCGELEKITNFPTDTHIFFSFRKGEEGLNAHQDDSHNLILLLDGMVYFKIWGKDDPLDKYYDPSVDVDMSSGDVVYIPANVYHQSTPLSDKKLSLSFPMSISGGICEDRHWITL